MRPEVGPDEFVLELDGPDTHPGSVDPAKFLAFASAYFELVKAIGNDEGIEVAFAGLQVNDKCIEIVSRPDNMDKAEVLASESARLISSDGLGGYLGKRVDSFRAALLAFSDRHFAKVSAGLATYDLTARRGDHPENGPYAVEDMRVMVLSAGGDRPTAHLRNVLDRELFVSKVSKEQARAVAAHLYEEMDVIVTACRNAAGKIVTCTLDEFTPLSDADPTEAWREWFRPHREFWDNVTDIESALGRRDRS